MEDIARNVQDCRANGSWSPRVDDLPYYKEPVCPVPKTPLRKLRPPVMRARGGS